MTQSQPRRPKLESDIETDLKQKYCEDINRIKLDQGFLVMLLNIRT
jgi:hypothetical protein